MVFSPDTGTVLSAKAEDVLVALSNTVFKRANLVYKTIGAVAERLPGSGVESGEPPGSFFIFNRDDGDGVLNIRDGANGDDIVTIPAGEFAQGVFHQNVDPWIIASLTNVNAAIFFTNE